MVAGWKEESEDLGSLWCVKRGGGTDEGDENSW